MADKSMAFDCFLILASGSPRRREFMEILGVPFTVVVPSEIGRDVDETPRLGEQPPNLVQRLSHLKAKAIVESLSFLNPPTFDPPAGYSPHQGVVIAADTVVVLNDEILGKPLDPDDARHMLRNLRREPHWVYTGFTVAIPSKIKHNQSITDPGAVEECVFVTRLHRSKVVMRPYTDAEIDAYIAGGDPMDKAGAYGIQNRVFAPVAQLDGCFASVMGLPLGLLADALREVGIQLPPIGPRCQKLTGQACCQK